MIIVGISTAAMTKNNNTFTVYWIIYFNIKTVVVMCVCTWTIFVCFTNFTLLEILVLYGYYSDSILSFPESVLPFAVSGYRLNDSALCHLLQKFRCSGRLDINYFHHICTSENRLTRKRLAKLANVTCSFRLEHFLNVRFFYFNVHFFVFNVRFSAILKIPLMCNVRL